MLPISANTGLALYADSLNQTMPFLLQRTVKAAAFISLCWIK
jgi:hypothetical protein